MSSKMTPKNFIETILHDNALTFIVIFSHFKCDMHVIIKNKIRKNTFYFYETIHFIRNAKKVSANNLLKIKTISNLKIFLFA